MRLSQVNALVALVAPATAFWRLPCSGPVDVERLDPIVNPGGQSGHVHTIMGGNGFDKTMTYETTQKSTCSSCRLKHDLSNYWVPTLYYKAKNGTFTSVKQGGVTVYYQQRDGGDISKAQPGTNSLLAFPAGFRMVTGDSNLRTPGPLSGTAIKYSCLYGKGNTPGFPKQNCEAGLRAEIYFPSCWDGVNLDSPDHKSHMSYPIGAYDNGKCPDSHPKRLISIFYEVSWNIDDFKDGWWDGTNAPFVLSNGDATGLSLHGDFLNGWDVPFLQKAVNTCTDNSGNIEACQMLKDDMFTNDQSNQCKITPKFQENVFGNMAVLPGNPGGPGAPAPYVPPGSGAPASSVAGGSGSGPASTATGTSPAGTQGSGSLPTSSPVSAQSGPSASKTSVSQVANPTASSSPSSGSGSGSGAAPSGMPAGWKKAGCYVDTVNPRTFEKGVNVGGDVTNVNCVKTCSDRGYAAAGTEYAGQCYCSKSVMGTKAPDSECSMKCKGDANDICGGPARLTVWSKSTASTRRSVLDRRASYQV